MCMNHMINVLFSQQWKYFDSLDSSNSGSSLKDSHAHFGPHPNLHDHCPTSCWTSSRKVHTSCRYSSHSVHFNAWHGHTHHAFAHTGGNSFWKRQGEAGSRHGCSKSTEQSLCGRTEHGLLDHVLLVLMSFVDHSSGQPQTGTWHSGLHENIHTDGVWCATAQILSKFRGGPAWESVQYNCLAPGWSWIWLMVLPEGALHAHSSHQVWPGRVAPVNVACAVKGLN